MYYCSIFTILTGLLSLINMLNMSIKIVQKSCLNCGAPLTGLSCSYCDTIFSVVKESAAPAEPMKKEDLLPKGLFEVTIDGKGYRVLGELARGKRCQILLARRARAATEQVVIKLSDNHAHLREEWHQLRNLQGRRSYLDRLLPQPVACGKLETATALVYRWRSGFVYNLEQVKKSFPNGVDPAAAVWMWGRLLDQIACLASFGYSHGGIELSHVLIHPRDHGIALCSWGRAGLGEPGDLEASGRCIAELLGRRGPTPLLALADKAGTYTDPEQLAAELRDTAQRLFGEPKFTKFIFP